MNKYRNRKRQRKQGQLKRNEDGQNAIEDDNLQYFEEAKNQFLQEMMDAGLDQNSLPTCFGKKEFRNVLNGFAQLSATNCDVDPKSTSLNEIDSTCVCTSSNSGEEQDPISLNTPPEYLGIGTIDVH